MNLMKFVIPSAFLFAAQALLPAPAQAICNNCADGMPGLSQYIYCKETVSYNGNTRCGKHKSWIYCKCAEDTCSSLFGEQDGGC
jgi:hypothetical protein